MTDIKYDHDPDFPYLVVNTSGEPCAKYSYRQGADLLLESWKGYGRVIDTTPKPKIPAEALNILVDDWDQSVFAFRGNPGSEFWLMVGNGPLTEGELLEYIGDAEVTVLVRKEGS